MAAELSGAEPGLVAYWPFSEGAGVTVPDHALASHTATMYNGLYWVAGGPMELSIPDVSAPEISTIVVTAVTEPSATIVFSTNEEATGWVAYAQYPASQYTDVYGQGPGTHHVVTVGGLVPDTQYSYQATASDAAGNTQFGPTH